MGLKGKVGVFLRYAGVEEVEVGNLLVCEEVVGHQVGRQPVEVLRLLGFLHLLGADGDEVLADLAARSPPGR